MRAKPPLKPRSVGQLVLMYRDLAGSGNKAARLLGVSQAMFAEWASGKELPSGPRIAAMAKAVHVEPDYALVLLSLERAPDEIKPIWQRIMEHLAAVALAIGAGTLAAPSPAGATLHNHFPRHAPLQTVGEGNTHCRIKRRRGAAPLNAELRP